MLIDLVEDFLKKNGQTSFKDLVINLNVSMDKLGDFYNELTLDRRFKSLEDNVWDLRERYCFEEIHIDYNDEYEMDEFDSDDILDDEDTDKAISEDDLKKILTVEIEEDTKQ